MCDAVRQLARLTAHSQHKQQGKAVLAHQPALEVQPPQGDAAAGAAGDGAEQAAHFVVLGHPRAHGSTASVHVAQGTNLRLPNHLWLWAAAVILAAWYTSSNSIVVLNMLQRIAHRPLLWTGACQDPLAASRGPAATSAAVPAERSAGDSKRQHATTHPTQRATQHHACTATKEQFSSSQRPNVSRAHVLTPPSRCP